MAGPQASCRSSAAQRLGLLGQSGFSEGNVQVFALFLAMCV